MKFGTSLIHNGNTIDETTGALSIPIYQTSTFQQKSVGVIGKYEYSRSGNPTREALENTIAILEGGEKGYAFSSGMAATSSVLSTFSAGDHIIICQDVYGGTYRVGSKFFNNFNIDISFVDVSDLNNIEKEIKSNTKGIYLESPSNPLLRITDLRGAVDIAKKYNLITMIDNTFMSPYLQRPLDLGIDIVIHSATKFIGGHSDVIGGLVVANRKDIVNKIEFVQKSFGAILGPQDCWLLLRGLKTLKLRLDYQQQSAIKIAELLQTHEKVKEVYYPGLTSHPGHNIHASQADGPGAVLSFITKDGKTSKNFMNNVKLAALAVSLGGVETIVSHPATMSHASIPKKEREELGIMEDLIRVSVGIEDTEDLLNDFDRSLKISD